MPNCATWRSGNSRASTSGRNPHRTRDDPASATAAGSFIAASCRRAKLRISLPGGWYPNPRQSASATNSATARKKAPFPNSIHALRASPRVFSIASKLEIDEVLGRELAQEDQGCERCRVQRPAHPRRPGGHYRAHPPALADELRRDHKT